MRKYHDVCYIFYYSNGADREIHASCWTKIYKKAKQIARAADLKIVGWNQIEGWF